MTSLYFTFHLRYDLEVRCVQRLVIPESKHQVSTFMESELFFNDRGFIARKSIKTPYKCTRFEMSKIQVISIFFCFGKNKLVFVQKRKKLQKMKFT